MADDFEDNLDGAMSQLQQLEDERQRETEDQYIVPNPSAMSLPTHFHNGRTGFCSPDRSFYGASYQFLGGGPPSAVPTTDYAPATASMTAASNSAASANYNITANNGNFHFHTAAESQAAAQLAQGFLPHNVATAANSDNATSSYYGSSSSAVPSPAHIHHHPALQTSPWTANPAAYFMLPKTSFEPYGLSHPTSYSTYGSPNYYQHQAAQNYGGAYGCPAAAAAAAAHHHQYSLSYYPLPSAGQISPEEVATSLAISQRPLNLSDSRLMPHHHHQPVRHQFVNSYGGEPIYPSEPSFTNGNDQYHSHYSSNQGLFYQSTDQQSTDKQSTESPSPRAPVLQQEEETKDDGGRTEDKGVIQFFDKSAIVQAAETLDADPDATENEIDVADYKSDLVIVEEEHSSPAAQLSNDSNLNPIDKSEVKDFFQLKPKSRKRIRGRPKKDHALELISFKQPSAFVMPDIDVPPVLAADDDDEPASIKIPKSNAALRTGFSTSDVQEPIIRTPDSSGTLNTAQKLAKKRIRKRSSQPASSHLSDKVLPITNHQLQALEAKFQENPFLSDVLDRKEFGSKIDLSEHRIAVWFQNRRTKERKVGRMPAGILPTGYTHPENKDHPG